MEELELERLTVKGVTYALRDASKQEKLIAGSNITIRNNVISANTDSNIVQQDASVFDNYDIIINMPVNSFIVLSNLEDGATYSYTNAKGVVKHFVGNSDYDLIFRSCGGGKMQPISFPIALD